MRKQVVTMLKAEELLELVTPEIVIDIMAENGSKLYDRTIDSKTGQSLLWFRTICHGGDSHKLCYFREGKDFYCYTNCGKMNLFRLIANVKSFPFYKAVYFVAQHLNINNRKGFTSNQFTLCSKEIAQLEAVQEYKKKKKAGRGNTFNPTPVPVLQTNIMDFFEDVYYLGWIREGISIETMKKFNIKWYDKRKHIIIPHVNIKGDLVGIRRRTLNEEEVEYAKYMPETIQNTTYAHALGLNLYGLYQNKETIKKSKAAILTEGEKSVLLYQTFFRSSTLTISAPRRERSPARSA